MKAFPKLILLCGLALPMLPAAGLRAQGAEDGDDPDKRVQYQLILPDEKTPENVKPEEHNPFESESEAQNRMAPGDTEENRVRDLLLKLPVVGTKRMSDGRMSVLLGNIILETGKTVPPVLPEQLVELKVKNITADYIELAWQEKRATGLPPKLMIIPINLSPKVRYKMFGPAGENSGASQGPNATMDLSLRGNTSARTALAAPPAPKAGYVDDSEPHTPATAPQTASDAPPAVLPGTAASARSIVQLAAQPAPAVNQEDDKTPPQARPAPAPTPAVESVVRMLFGNPTPAPK